ncbi:MAG: hypothetical protein ABL930_02195 [Pseudobdellovibrio sp.]
MTFGIGVNQGEDLASFLYQKMPKYNVYNMGIPGGGMNEILSDVVKNMRLNDINNLGGAVVYTMFNTHITRTFCSVECHEGPAKWMKYQLKDTYDFNDAGELISTGSYFESNRLLFYHREILAKSNFLKFIGFERPKHYSDEYIEKYIRYINFLKTHYQKFNLEFYVYLPIVDNFFSVDFKTRLEKNGIKVIAYNNKNLQIHLREKLNIPGEGIGVNWEMITTLR